jgi:hypothetical protein
VMCDDFSQIGKFLKNLSSEQQPNRFYSVWRQRRCADLRGNWKRA